MTARDLLHASERSARFPRHVRETHGIPIDGLDRYAMARIHRAIHLAATPVGHDIGDVRPREDDAR